MTSEINLLPMPRRIANDRRRMLRRWTLWGGLWCALLGAGQAIAISSREAVAVDPVERELERLQVEEARLDDELRGLDLAIERDARSLAATRAIVDHPDWSALLSRVVTVRSAGMTFRRWTLARSPLGAVELRIEGTVPVLGGLTDFALRLEDLRVFRRVSIITAQAQPTVQSNDAPAGESAASRSVTFTIDAELIGAAPPPGSPAPSTPAGTGGGA